MKKIIYLVLAVCMLLTAIPFVGYATETTDTEQAAAGKVCRIGDVYYDTLDAAFAAVKDNETVTMIADYAQKGTLPIPAGITVTLDGNGHTLTRADSPSGTLLGDLKSNVTFANLKFHAPIGNASLWGPNQLIRSIAPAGDTLTLTLKNSEVSLGAAFIGEHIGANKTFNLKMTNSTLLVSQTQVQPFISKDCTSGQTVNIEMDASTLTTVKHGQLLSLEKSTAKLILRNGSALNLMGGGNPINGWGGSATKYTVELYGSQISLGDTGGNIKPQSILFQWTNCIGSLKMDGTSTIKSVRTNDKTGNGTGAYLWRLQNGSNVTLDLAKGAVIEMADTCGAAGKNSFFMFDGGGKVTIDDKGAEWKVSADLLKKGFVLNDFGGTQIGWTNGTALYAPNEAVKNESATAALTLQPVFYTAADFSNEAGASIRVTEPYGIRFTVDVSSAFASKLAGFTGTSVSYGAILAPTAKVTGAFTKEALGDGNYVTTNAADFQWATQNVDGKSTYRVALVEIPQEKSALTMKFSATGFFTVTYANGTSRTFYAAYNATANSRSLYEVAQLAQADGVTGAAITQIIAICSAE